MVDLEIRIKSISDKLQLLLRQQQLLLKDNQRLKKELEKAQLSGEEKDAAILLLQQQTDALKLGAAQRTPEEKAELEKRINGYLKEIDKCLALLNA
ncbi:hypothetical protein [Sediminibacterium ginsengisoli]|uniref:Cell division protein ZapB n=1 Tax=Sediminibacterium ginsengisoli TaxID=413434 RepID=A0A1T4JWC7_9BACT|nr:hypothetical protein [Sediminibacterium ginsengisoli]SJZ34500.1 hypothetical protein SAMN04488132_101259 [Sediminibacterium ginsengisoli]